MAKDLRLPLPSDAQHPVHSQNIIMGRAADPWRAAETWIRCLASHCVPLHAEARLSAPLAAEWRTNVRAKVKPLRRPK